MEGTHNRRDEDGEGTGEDEGGGLRSLSISAEGDSRSLERSAVQDPPQDLGELAQRHLPPRTTPRHLFVMLLTSSSFFFLIPYTGKLFDPVRFSFL